MGISNFLSKIGRKTGKLFQQGLSKGHDVAKKVSRGIGKLESVFDSAMNRAHQMPVLRDIVDLIRDNSIYKTSRGIIDDVRGLIESDKADDIVKSLSNIDFDKHTVQDIIPQLRSIGSNIGIGARVPAQQNTPVQIPSGAINNVAVS